MKARDLWLEPGDSSEGVSPQSRGGINDCCSGTHSG